MASAMFAAAAIPGALIVQGVTEIPGTYFFAFNTGSIGVSGGDVFWNQVSPTVRHLDPVNGAGIVNLGAVNFANITAAQLTALNYTTNPIDGSDGTSLLVAGDVFAVRTINGNFAKVLVVNALDPMNNGITIQFATFAPAPVVPATPAPTSLLLMLTGLAGVSVFMMRSRIATAFRA